MVMWPKVIFLGTDVLEPSPCNFKVIIEKIAVNILQFRSV